MAEHAHGRSYQRTVLYEADAFEVVLCEWPEGAVSPLHAHGMSACSVLVQEGRFENRTELGFKTEVEVKEAGQVFTTPLGASHEIRCLRPGKTLHVYSPKISKEASALDLRPRTTASVRAAVDVSLGAPVTWENLREAFRAIEKHSLPTQSPYFMNQLFAGVLPQTLAAEDVVNRTRTTLATFEASPVYSVIELETVKALGTKIGWRPADTEGISVAGGSAANFMAVHCARHRAWPESKRRGLGGLQPRLYVSTEAHYSFEKAVVALGLGLDSLVTVETDVDGRMKPEALEARIAADMRDGYRPFFIGATAGTTVTGAFDPFEELARIAAKHDLWLHVDAAWGAPAYFSKRAAHLVRGSHLADSVTFDAHKFFGSGLTSTFFLTRHASILFDANDVKGGEYLFHASAELDRGRMSWQCGRGAEGLAFWALWKNLGDEGMTRSIDRMLELKDATVDFVRARPRLRLVSEPEFLNVCVEVIPESGEPDARWSARVREALRERNQAMINYSTDKSGRTFLRLILVHPMLELEHVTNMLSWALAAL